MTVDNAAIAELLALEAPNHEGHVAKAYRRAARRAFTWPVEAADVVAQGRELTELRAIGPYLARVVSEWIDSERDPPSPPPLRAGFITLAAARATIAGASMRPRGDLQMHTTDSDGGSTLEEMAAAGAERGYEYIAITDHSHGLRIVKGLDPKGLRRQALEIARVNEHLEGLTVLRSIEMNLDPSGGGDLDGQTLSRLDLVLGSFHSALRRTEDQTERYLAALAHPQLHILGHPRGRIYNYRLGLVADWPRVFDAAAAADKAVEIDAYPDRQDLDVDLLKMAASSGVRISIGTDAHHAPQLEWIDIGVAAAIRAGIAPERILNVMPLPELLDWAADIRSRAA